jgi:hypothetical protein
MIIGQQKGINTKMRQLRNFGMANPEGYRKALRLTRSNSALPTAACLSIRLNVTLCTRALPKR